MNATETGAPAGAGDGQDKPSLAPVAEDERLTLIDSLRGFALAGVYFINLDGFALEITLTPGERASLPLAAAAPAFDHLVAFFVAGKAITLFSLLFGIGFAIQMERAELRGADIAPVYVRRLLVLFGLGALHALLWFNDILHDYALLGLLLLFFRRAPSFVLVGLGLAAAAVAQPLLDFFLASSPQAAAVDAAVRDGHQVLRDGDLGEALRANFTLLVLVIVSLHAPLLFVFGRLLLGFWIGRSRILHEPARHRRLIWALFVVSFGLGVAAEALASGLRHAGHSGEALIYILQRGAGLAIGFSYAMGFALLFLNATWRKVLEVLAPVGRMALTHYLMQTLISLPLFYGFGLGLGPRLGWPGAVGVFIIVFAAQVAFSHWWLKRFRFGPAEWAWRSLTYGKAQPFRAAPAARA